MAESKEKLGPSMAQAITLFCLDYLARKPLPFAILWTVAIMALEFFAGSLYAFITLQTSGNDWCKFWTGKHTSNER